MGKKKKQKRLIGTLIFSIIFALLFKWWTTGNPFQSSTIFFCAIIFIILIFSFSISDRFFGYFMAMPLTKVKKYIIPAFILFMLTILFVSLIFIGVSLYAMHLVTGSDTSHFMDTLLEVELPGAIKYFSICSLIVSAYFFYKIWRQAIDREQLLREENLKHKYRRLKTQVNPHFLFNSLNTLSEIIYTDTRKADRYILKLAGIYRYILDNEETDLIPLVEEMRFVNAYFSLQKERNGSKIQLETNLSHPERYAIIPISLQILIENALKHNSASDKKPLKITVSETGDSYITISNNIQKKNILGSSHKTGLSNLKERVKLIMGKEMIIECTPDLFIVKLPLNKLST